MSNEQIYEETEISEEAEDQEEEFDWFIEQTPFTEQASPLDAPKYGFANQKSGVFQRLQVDFFTQLLLKLSKILFVQEISALKQGFDKYFINEYFLCSGSFLDHRV